MKIRTKLFGSFIIVSLIGVLLGVMGLYFDKNLTALSKDMLDISATKTDISSILNAHFTWRHELYEKVYAGTAFTGSLDPNTCSLGKWMNSDAAKKMTDPEDVAMLRHVVEPHNFIHARAEEIINNLNNGETDKATKIFRDEVLPKTQEVISGLEKMEARYDVLVNGKIQEIYNLGLEFEIIIITLIIVVLITSVLLALVITSNIAKPLKIVMDEISKLEKGDMTVRANLKREDELGALARAIDNLSSRFQSIMKGLRVDSDALAGASEQLSAISRQLANGSEETVAQSNTVASTTEQMAVNINAMASGAEEASANANEVAGAAEEMSGNMNTITSAIKEMISSINQIANNAGEARNVAIEATGKASNATDVMGKLGAAAMEIGHVTDVIKKIADKTNLLALNATIEAASAGEAGKGFAVVAGEIKELANQSATSADDIARRIESIQTGTGDAVTVINDVSDIIIKINQSIEAIAGHVEQQTKASNEIANSVTQANAGAKRVASAIGEVAKGANDVSRNAGEAAKGATNVSHNVGGMSQVAKETAQGAAQVNQSADDLSRIASDLKNTVGMFRL